MRSLAIGATGMLAQQTNVDVISNNIANMNTTAYTKRRAEFNDLLYQNITRPGSATTRWTWLFAAAATFRLSCRKARGRLIPATAPFSATATVLS